MNRLFLYFVYNFLNYQKLRKVNIMKKRLIFIFILTLLLNIAFINMAHAIDRTPPKMPTLNKLSLLNKSTYLNYKISGKGEPNSTVAVYINDGKKTLFRSATVSNKGYFTVPINTSTLKEGKLNVYVSLVDRSKNRSQVKSFNLYKDTLAPTRPWITSSDYSEYIDLSNRLYTVTGSVEKGAKVTISLKTSKGVGGSKTVYADNNGTFKATLDMTKFTDGTYYLKVNQTDIIGNASAQFSKTVVKISKYAPSIISAKDYINKNDKLHEIEGNTSVKSGKVRITFSSRRGLDTPYVVTVPIKNDGTYSALVDTDKLLYDDTYDVTTVYADSNGKFSMVHTTKTVVDRIAPKDNNTVFSLVNPQKLNVKGVSELNGLVFVSVKSIGKKTLYGLEEDDIYIYIELEETGIYNRTFTIPEPLEGVSYQVEATIYDAYGNEGLTRFFNY